jgi:hypothetical protein
MQKVVIIFSSLFILGLLAWPQSVAANQYAGGTPTAPPPPMASKTSLPPTNTHLPPQRPTNTATRYAPPTSRVSKTSTVTLAPVVTDTETSTVTPTITPTITLTPTLTPTFTPTPFLNLHVVVYLDVNQDNLLEFGEGVDDLLLLINAEGFSTQVILHNGEAWLALPYDSSPGSDVQVQAPYLHWSDLLSAPKPGEILEASLRLNVPQFPVFLP